MPELTGNLDTGLSVRQLQRKIEALEKTNRDLLDRIEKLSSLLDNLPGMAFRCLYDAELTFEYASRGSMEILGYDPAEIVSGYAFRQLVHKEDQPVNKAILERISSENRSYELVYRMRSASGEEKWIYEQGMAIFSREGKLEAIEGLLTDITNQKLEELELRKENIRLRSSIKDRWRFGELIGKSQPMQKVYSRIIKAASTAAAVIITGESGTGKELAARAIHDISDRKNQPFITVNCGAIPENLMESEFFGHRKGSFSGAHADRPGFLEAAHGGSLFLDEIGEMPLQVQVKLLRALDGKGFVPVGGNRVRHVDFRLISATNRNMEQLVRDGAMREDFYYRINTVPIRMPSLRERKDDIPLLINHFLSRFSKSCGKELEIPLEAQLELIQYNWPGNVRELHNVINRYLTLEEISFPECSVEFKTEKKMGPADQLESIPKSGQIAEALDMVEKDLILTTLEQHRWNVTKAAEVMNISRRTLQRRIKKYGLKS